MRRLGLFLCGVLLTACTSGGEDYTPPEPNAEALTAEEVLGEYGTVDYCTLLDPAGGTPVSSFEHCRVDTGALRRVVGPVQSDAEVGLDPSLTEALPHPDLPPGVAVREPVGGQDSDCRRWVGFSDHMWLLVSAVNTGEGQATDPLCRVADDLVDDVLDAVEGGRVEHVSYGPESYGSLDPCAVLNRPEIQAVVGADVQVSPSAHGHDCLFGEVGLSFTVGEPSVGTQETVGGRPAVVSVEGAFCFVTVERALPDRPGFVEKAKFTGVSVNGETLGNGADSCADVRAVAGIAVPGLPQ